VAGRAGDEARCDGAMRRHALQFYRLAHMASGIQTNVTELPESRVRVEAEVPATEVDKRIKQTASALGRQMRIPGFRKGKVPPPVIIQRMGREVVLDETVRESLGRWYVEAVDDAGIVTVGDPELDLGDLPGEGEPLKFTIEIGVRPKATLGDYTGLEVGKRDADVPDETVERELEALREQMAKLETVERAAGSGDFIVMDYRGEIDGEAFEGGEARDQLLELGSGRLIPGFEEQLEGAKAAEERTVEVTFPDDYQAEHLAGKTARFAVTVKDVKAKELPELDDELASDAAGFDTLSELKADIRTRLEEADRETIENEFREAVVDAAVANATLDVPHDLVHARAHEMFEQLMHSLQHRGISKDAYLQITGKDETELAHEAMPEAEQQLKREAVLAAIVEAEAIEPTDDEVLEALESSAEREGTSPKKLLERLKSAGRLEALRTDLAHRQAVDKLVEGAKPIDVAQAQARDDLWTPDKDEKEAAEGSGSEAGGKLWTPGD
jgi:trigger factor